MERCDVCGAPGHPLCPRCAAGRPVLSPRKTVIITVRLSGPFFEFIRGKLIEEGEELSRVVRKCLAERYGWPGPT